jgi:disulfide bond formation protein DsbB
MGGTAIPEDVRSPSNHVLSSSLTLIAFGVALVALVGSLWLSVGMGLKACPLCLYQRTFVMGVVGVLAVGWLIGVRQPGLLDLLVLPCAVSGLSVALFHEYLEWTGKLECPTGIFGWGTAPQQSLGVLSVLFIVLSLGSVTGQANRLGLSTFGAAIIVGVLFAIGAIASAPPMAATPTKPYEQPLEICRPPYRSP